MDFRDKSDGNVLGSVKKHVTYLVRNIFKDPSTYVTAKLLRQERTEEIRLWSDRFQLEQKIDTEKKELKGRIVLTGISRLHAPCIINLGNLVIAADSSPFFLPRFFRRYLNHVVIASKYFSQRQLNNE